MKNKLAIVIILLMASLNLVPPLLVNTDYFDNSFYMILFLLLAFLGFTVPFLADKLNKHIKRVSILLGSLFFSGLITEIFNLTIPKIVLNSSTSNLMYFKAVICFMIGLVVIMSTETWSTQKRY